MFQTSGNTLVNMLKDLNEIPFACLQYITRNNFTTDWMAFWGREVDGVVCLLHYTSELSNIWLSM